MPEKKDKLQAEERKPVQTFREGAVGGSVWMRQSNTGFWYYDFSLSRSWKSMSSGKDGYSSNFFDRNRDELHRVIDACCDYIEDKIQNAETVTINLTDDESDVRQAA